MLARNAQDIGNIVKSRRNAIGMTQQELATLIGVNRRWVGELEAGHPRAELALVLDALDAVAALVNVIDNPGSPPDPSGLGASLSMPPSIDALAFGAKRRNALLGRSGPAGAADDA